MLEKFKDHVSMVIVILGVIITIVIGLLIKLLLYSIVGIVIVYVMHLVIIIFDPETASAINNFVESIFI